MISPKNAELERQHRIQQLLGIIEKDIDTDLSKPHFSGTATAIVPVVGALNALLNKYRKAGWDCLMTESTIRGGKTFFTFSFKLG